MTTTKTIENWLAQLQGRDVEDLYRTLKAAQDTREGYTATLLLEKLDEFAANHDE